ELTREAVFEALRNRRTYGVTGDRIRLGFTLNGHVMGQEIPFVRERNLAVQATGWDSIERVEVLRNNEVIHRDFPMDRKTAASPWRKPVLVRIELGWGPWASLEIPRVCDWEADIELRGGQILEYQPCFQSGPLDEKRRNRVSSVSDAGLQITSYTSRKQAFAESPTNAVVLRIQGNAETSIEVKLSKPSLQSVKKNFSELARSNQVTFTGPFPDESLIVHRPVMEANASTSFSFTNEGTGNSADWYYVRVVQANGQMAWSSPIWVEKRA
ncbi:MAG: hypothetical protein U9P14_10525, partial [Gemmatimonadota bacterium]|nr:hypothetical protein [Gemmatimonadota bacterium]